MAVIILSENYASSTWCLEELVKIVECMKGGLKVLPIFYHVDPSHVRHQKETFAVAFDEHGKRLQENPEKVQIWRTALREVTNLSGKTLMNGPEAEFIRKIVDWIFIELKDKCSTVYGDGFVGIDSCVEEMISCLDMNSNDVRFIGICGESGMDKTTLARLVFEQIHNQFEACSILENVEEVSKAHGLETLQEQLLCDISKGALRVRDVNNGIQVIRNVLQNKKVLIVVDDVFEKKQLEALVGKRDWYGPKSRIIVITKDIHSSESNEIQTVYKANGLNDDEALQLFSYNAFHKAHRENDLLYLGNDFVTYAQGIPLVLKILGSHLCKRTKEEWESAWNQLKAIPNENILEKLQIAYNGLEELEKKLFLDIACFFKGED
ncbi:disease resistance protein RUN1-like [Quercus robur]|uniref:disease resistance protein RUN1-like n=1 Tax=Quercus robur TaxID=38942 RepID=UPI002162CFB1|nr:disease resistance protein RUN1-like [Quercus robur]